MPAIDLTADERAAVAAAVRRAIEEDARRGSIRCERRWPGSRRPHSQRRTRRPKSTSARGDNRRRV